MNLPLKKCPTCHGKGRVADRSLIGPMLRKEREAKGISGLSVAQKIGVDKSTLHDMEHGKRSDNWTDELIVKYRAAYAARRAEKDAKAKRRTKENRNRYSNPHFGHKIFQKPASKRKK